MSDTVLVGRIDESLMEITLNRPERLNAINDAFIEDMHSALDVVAADRDVRAVVLSGAGRGFCAGADLQEHTDLARRTSADLYRGQQRLAEMSVRLHELPVPVVAAVQGPAIGGGFALAAACDLRVASTEAFFAAANVRVGVSGGEMGLSWMLPQALGRARAAELLLSGRSLGAAVAHEWGFVNRLVGPDEGSVVDAAIDLARTITANPAFAVRLTKEMLGTNGTAASLREAVLLENRTQVLAVYAGDIDRATATFRSNRSEAR